MAGVNMSQSVRLAVMPGRGCPGAGSVLLLKCPMTFLRIHIWSRKHTRKVDHRMMRWPRRQTIFRKMIPTVMNRGQRDLCKHCWMFTSGEFEHASKIMKHENIRMLKQKR